MAHATHPHLSAADLERLRAKLVAKRDALLAAQRASLDEQRGVAEPESEDGDVAERMIEQEAALRVGAFDSELLVEVERAIEKIDAGTYGVSEESGAAISLERLEAVPWARRTVEEEERQPR